MLAFTPAHAAGSTYYVSTGGSDGNPGTEGAPFRTITRGAQVAGPGDTVYVHGGVYNEGNISPNSGSSGAFIRFMNYPGEVPILDGGGSYDCGVNTDSSYLHWEGFEVRNYTNRPMLFGTQGSGSHSNGIEVVHVYTHDNGVSSVFFYGLSNGVMLDVRSIHDTYGIAIDTSDNITVRDCSVDSPVIDGLTAYRAGQIIIDHSQFKNCDSTATDEHPDNIQIGVNSSNITITNNLVFNDNGYNGTGNNMGIFVEDTSGAYVANNVVFQADGYSMHVSNSQNVRLFNNAVYEGWWGNFYSLGNCSGLTLRNNIFFARDGSDNMNLTSDEGPGGRSIDYNLFYRPSQSDMIKVDGSWYDFGGYQSLGYDAHGKFGNPSWVNPGAIDLHLNSNSPAIDAGTSNGTPTSDRDGASRPVGAAFDMGPYEYGGTPSGGGTPPPPPPPPVDSHPNGMLIKGSGPGVYLLENGKRRPITSWTSFVSNGLRGDRIVTVPDSELTKYSQGTKMQVRPGALIKGSGPGVYLCDYVSGVQYRRPIGSASAFLDLGLHWEDVLPISDAELVSYTEGNALMDASRHPNGMLVKSASSTTVYLIDGTNKRPVTSPTSFVSWGYRWDRIVTISSSELTGYPTGSILQVRPGALVKGSGATVYICDYTGGVQYKRPISSAPMFDALGLHWEDILGISDAELATYTAGAAIN